LKLLIDLLRGSLDGSEHINNLWVIKERSLNVSESLEKLILVVLEDLGVGGYLLLDLLKLIIELLLLLSDKSSKKLLLKTTLCDSEINNDGFGGSYFLKLVQNVLLVVIST
jgi:hypothetical protein